MTRGSPSSRSARPLSWVSLTRPKIRIARPEPPTIPTCAPCSRRVDRAARESPQCGPTRPALTARLHIAIKRSASAAKRFQRGSAPECAKAPWLGSLICAGADIFREGFEKLEPLLRSTSLRLTLTTHARWSSRHKVWQWQRRWEQSPTYRAAGPGLCGSPIPRSGAAARLGELPDAPKILLRNVYAGSSGLILGSLPYPTRQRAAVMRGKITSSLDGRLVGHPTGNAARWDEPPYTTIQVCRFLTPRPTSPWPCNPAGPWGCPLEWWWSAL